MFCAKAEPPWVDLATRLTNRSQSVGTTMIQAPQWVSICARFHTAGAPHIANTSLRVLHTTCLYSGETNSKWGSSEVVFFSSAVQLQYPVFSGCPKRCELTTESPQAHGHSPSTTPMTSWGLRGNILHNAVCNRVKRCHRVTDRINIRTSYS